MKNILNILVLLSLLSCKAQTLPLYNPPNGFTVNNAYYKDLDGDLTKLVGTWKYTNGNEEFTIILKKKENDFVDMRPVFNEYNYEDALYGEYKYIDINNNEIINTLDKIENNNYTEISGHMIYGGYIKGKYFNPPCADCGINERRVDVGIMDPERLYFDYELEIRHIPADLLNNTPEKLRIIIRNKTYMEAPEGEPDDDRLPFGEFVFVKQ